MRFKTSLPISIIQSSFLLQTTWGTFAFAPNPNLTPCFTTQSRSSPHPCRKSSSLIVQQQSTTLSSTIAPNETSDEVSYASDVPLQDLCSLLQVDPILSATLYLQTENGNRGVFTSDDMVEDDIILRIPLTSTLRDNQPPTWFLDSLVPDDEDDDKEGGDDGQTDPQELHLNPSEWSTRLAASVIDLYLSKGRKSEEIIDELSSDDSKFVGQKQWLSMMPHSTALRASLPVHWPEEIISNAKCTALELSTDSSFFFRAQAVEDLKFAIKSSKSIYDAANEFLGAKSSSGDLEQGLNQLCHDALDIVQTRSCRLDAVIGDETTSPQQLLCPPLRCLAPVFDFCNHGSSSHSGSGSSNAYFGMEMCNSVEGNDNGEDMALVIRARRDIKANEEILIDYGESTRPSWKCLASYGFIQSNAEVESDSAEIFLDGNRYEVTIDSIPSEMVEVAAAMLLQQQGYDSLEMADEDMAPLELTPEIALFLSNRLLDAASQMVNDLNIDFDDIDWQFQDETKDDIEPSSIAKALVSSLQQAQRGVLLKCSEGLREYADGHGL